jgi:hypothetical protein
LSLPPVSESDTNCQKSDVPYSVDKVTSKCNTGSLAGDNNEIKYLEDMRPLIKLFVFHFVMLFGHIVEGAPHSINIFKVPMGGTASNCSLSLGQRDTKLEDGFELLPRACY